MAGPAAIGPNGRFVQDATNPALWANTQWGAGTPGLFALVIGVSAYPHLKDGTGALATQHFDLPQLHVSALTALDVLDWLVEEHQGPVPVAQIWFLASPTDAERAEAETHRSGAALAGAPDATYAACEAALTGWWATMRGLRGVAATSSRSSFFFSGHGLEIHRDKQMLLPSDYLAPPAELHNRCFSTSNIVGAVSTLPSPEHALMVDACRSGSDELRRLVLDGMAVLNETTAGGMNGNAVVPVLYAAAEGKQAFQPTKVTSRSLYGTALLEGLRGEQGVEVRTANGVSSVWLYQLQPMMKRRVAELAAQRAGGGQPVEQRVLVGGIVDELELARLPQRSTLSTRSPGRPRRPGRDGSRDRTRGLHVDVPLTPDGKGKDGRALNRLLSRLDFAVVGDRLGGHLARTDPGATDWGRTGDGGRWMVTVQPWATGIATWMTIEDGRGGAFATSLPIDGQWYEFQQLDSFPSAVGYQVVLESDALSGPTPSVTGLAIRAIERSSWSMLRQVLDAYQVAVDEGVGAANAALDERLLEQAVEEKRGSPLAAVIAGDLLLQLQSNRLPGQWLQNLTNWFQRWPDPPILLAEHAMREQDEELWHLALDRISEYGLPFLAGNVARLDRVLRQGTRNRMGSDPGQFEALRSLLDRALPHYLPGGLLARWRFAGPPPGPEFLRTGAS